MSKDKLLVLAWNSNVERLNLSSCEKANLVQMKMEEGHRLEDIARLLGRSVRHTSRFLKLPREILEHVDGKIVTMKHAEYLAKIRRDDGEVESIVAAVVWVRLTGASSAQLLTHIKKEGLVEARGRKKKFGKLPKATIIPKLRKLLTTQRQRLEPIHNRLHPKQATTLAIMKLPNAAAL